MILQHNETTPVSLRAKSECIDTFVSLCSDLYYDKNMKTNVQSSMVAYH